ncbi:MAG: hypothetical protein KatS3mg083_148 [Candidatus Dojkabacteria bacterium]|nr:MAG: hypothetical protein KatS3mg083_148 [Candidatus Dojkabacteria bacterium]
MSKLSVYELVVGFAYPEDTPEHDKVFDAETANKQLQYHMDKKGKYVCISEEGLWEYIDAVKTVLAHYASIPKKCINILAVERITQQEIDRYGIPKEDLQEYNIVKHGLNYDNTYHIFVWCYAVCFHLVLSSADNILLVSKEGLFDYQVLPRHVKDFIKYYLKRTSKYI